MADFEKIKDYFKDSDPEVKAQIIGLEARIKTANLYNNLKQHDAIKMILVQCDTAIDYYNGFLRDQEVADEADKVKRARFMAFRDSFQWIKNLFTVETKIEVLDKKAKALEEQAGGE